MSDIVWKPRMNGGFRTNNMEGSACRGQKDFLKCSCKHGISVSPTSAMKLRIIKKEDQ